MESESYMISSGVLQEQYEHVEGFEYEERLTWRKVWTMVRIPFQHMRHSSGLAGQPAVGGAADLPQRLLVQGSGAQHRDRNPGKPLSGFFNDVHAAGILN